MKFVNIPAALLLAAFALLVFGCSSSSDAKKIADALPERLGISIDFAIPVHTKENVATVNLTSFNGFNNCSEEVIAKADNYDYVPNDIEHFEVSLDDVNGEQVLTKQIPVRSNCTDDYQCYEIGSSSLKLFALEELPKGPNYKIQISAFDSTERPTWIGRNNDFDIIYDEDKPEDLHLDIFLRHVGSSTYSFNCMDTPRMFHTATLLRNSDILITGGVETSLPCPGEEKCTMMPASASVWLYRITTNDFIQLTDLMQPRAGHQTVMLMDGRLAIIGGASELRYRPDGKSGRIVAAEDGTIYDTIEIYNPDSGGSVVQQIIMTQARTDFTITGLDATEDLPASRFLIVGGFDGNGPTASIEMLHFDPYSGDTITARLISTSMQIPRAGHSATLMSNGSVLLYGGTEAQSPITELFIVENQPTEAINIPDSMEQWPSLFNHQAISIGNGKALIAGGMLFDIDNGYLSEPVSSAFVVNPFEGIADLFQMSHPRAFHRLISYSNERVLVLGGAGGEELTQTVAPIEMFANGFEPYFSNRQPISFQTPRFGHTTDVLPDDTIVSIGGAQHRPQESNSGIYLLNNAELFFHPDSI